MRVILKTQPHLCWHQHAERRLGTQERIGLVKARTLRIWLYLAAIQRSAS